MADCIVKIIAYSFLFFATTVNADDLSDQIILGNCPVVESSLQKENEDAGIWYTTHSTHNTTPIKCIRNNATAVSDGMNIFVSAFNEDDGTTMESSFTKYNVDDMPGKYVFHFVPEGQNFSVSGVIVSIMEQGYFLSWGCTELGDGTHVEGANIHSKTRQAPDSVVESFLQKLKSKGSQIKLFYPVDQTNCLK